MGLLGTILSGLFEMMQNENNSMDRRERSLKEFEKQLNQANDSDSERIQAAREKMEKAKAEIQKQKMEVARWDTQWECIGRLIDADLSPYNHCVGLYRHVIDGETVYIGRAIELYNGGLRKRLSDYRRQSASASKHQSGQFIRTNIDKIVTYVLVVGDTDEAIETTKKLEPAFIQKYKPRANKMFN